MKKLVLILLVLCFFFLLIYASSEPAREYDFASNIHNEKLSLIRPLPLKTLQPTPNLTRLRTCSEDEFNCNIIGKEYTQCVSRFKVCNHQIKCSNEDQIVCPTCNKSSIYCELSANQDKCVEIKKLCIDENEKTKCSSNQKDIEKMCTSIKLSQSNRPITTEATINNTDELTTDSFGFITDSTSLSGNSDLNSNPKIESENFNTKITEKIFYLASTKTYNSIPESSVNPELETTTELNKIPTTSNRPTTCLNHSSINPIITSIEPLITSTQSASSSTKKIRIYKGPKNIMDYSKMFKHDYGGFNFSNYIYKGTKKNGKFDWTSFSNGGKNKSQNSFSDYSKFMGGNNNGGFDYSKFMKGSGFDYSKFMSGYQGIGNNYHKNPDLKNSNLIKLTGSKQPTRSFTKFFDYSKYLKPGGHLLKDEENQNSNQIKLKSSKSKRRPMKITAKIGKTFHNAPYLKGFSKKFVKLQEEKQNELKTQNALRMDKLVMNPQIVGNEPILDKNDETNEPIRQFSNENLGLESNNQNLETEQLEPNQQQNHHHFQMENTKFSKEPSVNVSKIIPRHMSSSYSYNHTGSGIFFINLGTIITGSNNLVNSDGNDIGNGNGNGNNNGNTQGDNMRPGYDFSNPNNQPAKNPPVDSQEAGDTAEDNGQSSQSSNV